MRESDLMDSLGALNRAVGPGCLFAEPVGEGHAAGAVDVLVGAGDDERETPVRVVYDYDARPAPEGDAAYEPYAEDWEVVAAALAARFPGGAIEVAGWTDAMTLAEALSDLLPASELARVLTLAREAALDAGAAWRPGSIAVGKTSGMAFVVRDVDERGMLRLGADLSAHDPSDFEFSGEASDDVLTAIRSGSVTEAEIQEELLASARARGAGPDRIGPGEIDFDRSRWRRDDPGGWVYEAYLIGQADGEEAWAEARVEETRPGAFAPALFSGDATVPLPLPVPARGYGALDGARRAAMVQLEAVLGIEDGSLRARALDPMAPDPYPEQWRASMAEERAGMVDIYRSGIHEEVPGAAYQLVAVAWDDPESERAAVSDIVLDEAGAAWMVETHPDNGEPGEAVARSGPFLDFADACMASYDLFARSGKFSAGDLAARLPLFTAPSAMAERANRAAVAARLRADEGIPRVPGQRRGVPAVLLPDGWGWDIGPDGGAELMDAEGTVHIEILPERREIRIQGEPAPGATTWTADSDDVRVALEAVAARGLGLSCEVAEGVTWDDLIRSASKDLAKYEGMQAPRIEGAFQYASERERYERDLNELFEAAERGEKVGSRDTIFVCPTPAILVALGMEQRPIHLSKSHALRIIAPKDERKHHHGLTRDDLAALPQLMTAPAFIADALDTATRDDAVIMVLPEVDGDGLPLMAAIRPNDESVYELEALDTNRLMSVYGRNNVAGFLGAAVEQGKVLYVDKRKTEELEAQSQLQLLRGAAGLPSGQSVALSTAGGKVEAPGLMAAVAGLPTNTVIRPSAVIESAEGRQDPDPPAPGLVEHGEGRITYRLGRATDYRAPGRATGSGAAPAADRREAREAAESLKKELPGLQMQRRP